MRLTGFITATALGFASVALGDERLPCDTPEAATSRHCIASDAGSPPPPVDLVQRWVAIGPKYASLAAPSLDRSKRHERTVGGVLIGLAVVNFVVAALGGWILGTTLENPGDVAEVGYGVGGGMILGAGSVAAGLIAGAVALFRDAPPPRSAWLPLPGGGGLRWSF